MDSLNFRKERFVLSAQFSNPHPNLKLRKYKVRPTLMSQSEENFFSSIASNNNSKYQCRYDRCGRQFESEARLVDHVARIHERIGSSGSGIAKDNATLSISSLKLPQIPSSANSQTGSTQKLQKASKINELHPTIKQAQEFNNNSLLRNSGGRFTSSKKLSMSQTLKASSRPSSSSSTLNTTTSSTNNIEMMLSAQLETGTGLKNFYKQSPNLKMSFTKREMQGPLTSLTKKSVDNTIKNEIKENDDQRKKKLNESPCIKADSQNSNLFFKPTIKTKEEILFGKRPQKRTPLKKVEEPTKDIPQQKKEQPSKIPISKQKEISSDGDEEDDQELENELNREDQILKMNFSGDEEGTEIQIDDGESDNNQNQESQEENDDEEEEDNLEYEQNQMEIEKSVQKNNQDNSKNATPSKQLEKQYILEQTGCNVLKEVTDLMLRNKNLSDLNNSKNLDWNEFIQLSYLSVCHNPRMSSIEGLKSLPNPSLLELNLEYNAIVDISPLLKQTQLKSLFLSGNLIESIKDISIFTKLQKLSLTKNKIKGFQATLNALCSLPLLEELDLEQNPVSSRFSYKYDILWKLKLKKLDGENVTDLDVELSKTFQSEYLQFCRENSEQVPMQKMSRPMTANQNSASSFGQKSYKDRFKAKLGELVEESKQVLGCIPEDRVWELETELELAKQQEMQLEEELVMLQLEGREIQGNCEKKKEQNRELQQSIMEYKKEQKYQNELQQKYKQYVQILNSNTSNTSQFIKGIFKLNLKLEELQKQNTLLNKQNKNLQDASKDPTFNLSQSLVTPLERPKTALNQLTKSIFEMPSVKNQLTDNQNKNQQIQYDDAEDVFSSEDDEQEEEQKQTSKEKQQQKKQLQQKQENLNEIGLADENDDDDDDCKDIEEEEENNGSIGLDIGFDSDDLDEETKEIRDLLKSNNKALEDVKKELYDL